MDKNQAFAKKKNPQFSYRGRAASNRANVQFQVGASEDRRKVAARKPSYFFFSRDGECEL
jgi:hypothetical protein